MVGLPLGCEDIVVELVSAWVSSRVPGDDPTPHLQAVWGNPVLGIPGLWKEQLLALKKRYGRSVRQGFRSVMGGGW